MTEEELDAWRQFHLLYPIDDFHRIHRPAAVIASAFGGKYEAAIDFLQPKPKSRRPLKPVEVIRPRKE